MSTSSKGSKPGPTPSSPRGLARAPWRKIGLPFVRRADDGAAVEPFGQDVEKAKAAQLDEAASSADAPPPSLPPSPRGEDENADGFDYPEGGLHAWLVAFGAWCALFAGLGLINTIGTLQAYVSQHQLSHYNESTISWIFSIYVFIVFFCGLQIGPIFDKNGPRLLILAGSVLIVLCMMLLGLCTEYWHFVLVFSIIGGCGSSLLFTPSLSAIAHYFNKKRGNATGLVATAGSLGGVTFPLTLNALFGKIGFAWSCRVLGFIFLLACIVANILIRSRLPPKRNATVLPSLRIFLDGTGAFGLTTAATFFMEWGLFVPVAYLTSYSLANGVDPTFSYQIIAIFNAGSCFGRWLPGYFSDRVGRFNTMIITIAMCMATTFAFWLPTANVFGVSHAAVVPLIIVFAVLFGFCSGSNISLVPACVGQMCSTQEYGRYYATCYTIVSFSTLTGIPIAGALVNVLGGQYWGLIVWTGVCYVVSLACYIAAKLSKFGWSFKAVTAVW